MRCFERAYQFVDKYFWECVMVLWVVPFCFSAFSPYCFYFASSMVVHLLASVSIFLSFPCVIFVMLLFCHIIATDQHKARVLFRSFFAKDMIFAGMLLSSASLNWGRFSVFFKKNIPYHDGLIGTSFLLAVMILFVIKETCKNQGD